MYKIIINKIVPIAVAGALFLSILLIARADHSWGDYHWARTTNPFILKLGDNVSNTWDAHLSVASTDWSVSNILDTTVVPGKPNNAKPCKPVSGRVEICNSGYGNNGWLGIAQIWASGTHITQGVVKMNDTYFKTATYNKPSWKQFVMCQEIGHTLGLNHQDEVFSNPNLGTCMDYTNDPAHNDGVGNNLLPNAHDYEQLAIIYNHLDTSTTLAQTTTTSGSSRAEPEINHDDPGSWGQQIRADAKGKGSLYVRDLGRGEKVFTFVIWTE